jgi:FixJ family two-component response regulator
VGPSAIILLAAPDAAFRHSLVFALESDGFAVHAHGQATNAFASGPARDAVCAVIDDDSVGEWALASRQFEQFGRPVILLVGSHRAVPVLPFVHLVTKPFLGEPLIEAVRNAVAGTL